jgi:nicotinamidase/pyrazinamidase
MSDIELTSEDALVIVDLQNDFLPGGSLAVPAGNEVIPVLNHYISLFADRNLPIYATRDWHPENHCSFQMQGGIWPPHCVANTRGAEFAADLDLPHGAIVISKPTTPEKDAYSGFEQTDLASRLRSQGAERLFIGGLATDYCVLNTARDALAQGFQVELLLDAIRAVDVHAGDGQKATGEMIERGAHPLRLTELKAMP